MKKIGTVLTCFIAAGILAVFFSCVSYPNPGVSVCSKPEAAGSWICSVVDEYGLTVEQLEGILLDANAVAIISGNYSQEQARAFIKDLIFSVNRSQWTYSGLIMAVLGKVENSAMLFQLINRHLTLFKSDEIISSYDKYLILTHLENQLIFVGGCPDGECK